MLPLKSITIGEALKDAAKKYPNRPAIEYEGSVLTYLELDKETDHLATGFLTIGVSRGSHVAIWSELNVDMLKAYYALQKIGAVAVMLSTALNMDALLDQLHRTDCEWLIVGEFYSDAGIDDICAAVREDGCVELVHTVSRRAFDDLDLRTVQLAGSGMSRNTLLSEMALVCPEDPSMILFTSGTNSKPKAVVTTHYARINNGIQQADDLQATCEDRFCVMLPMFHCFCISTNILAALAVGGCLLLAEDRHSGTVLSLLEKHRCTIFNAVPTAFHSMIARPDFEQYDLSALRTGIIGGGTYTPDQFVQFEQKFGMTLLSSLGQTECTAGLTVSHMDDSLDVRSTTVGHFMNHVEYKFAHLETGEPQPAGERGEICVRGYLVMSEYYADSEQTAKTIDADGWCHTGDLGWLDSDGNVHLCGRIKELVIRGGENISPKEVADVLQQDPRVADVKVIGVKDDHYGEELCACVVAEKEAELTEEQVRQIVREKLEAFKVPAHVLFFEHLPYSTTGKIVLGRLQEMVQERGLTP